LADSVFLYVFPKIIPNGFIQLAHPFIVWNGPIFNNQSMTIPEHFIQLDKYVFVQGLDDFSSWLFLTHSDLVKKEVLKSCIDYFDNVWFM
jgi:hypothetical protein